MTLPVEVNPLLTGGGGGGSGYNISRSVRLRSSASAYLSRTLTAPTNGNIWTLSLWLKISKFDVQRTIFSAGVTQIYLKDTTNELRFYKGGQVAVSTSVFRDPSAYGHLVLVSNGTTVKGYWNNLEVISYTGTMPAINSATLHTIGSYSSPTDYFDGYLTDINFIDGQAPTPSSFGGYNSVTGGWEARKYTGTYGNNGFCLNFSDNSAATAAAIGKDSSGNGNNWTPNNISLTAGVTYDSMLDVPTMWADGGNGRGNYATLNPVDSSTYCTLSSGNLQTSSTSGAYWGTTRGTIGISSGKWYWEVTLTADVYGVVGILDTDTTVLAGQQSPRLGNQATGYGFYGQNGQKLNNGTLSAYSTSWSVNNVIGVALDLDAGTLTFYKNGTTMGQAFSGIIGTYAPSVSVNTGGVATQLAINFGQRPFSYTPPSGFKALHTGNLPAPAITKPNKNFDVSLYTGTGAAQSITNAGGFAPDLVWLKGRSVAYNHALFDVNRGVRNVLSSNLTNAEILETAGTSMTAFDIGGFSLGTNGGAASTNVNGSTFAAWQWKAGGTAVSNTAGTITSQVSANASAGFSVVTYTGTGANATVGHGLGVAPKMVIVKVRSAVDNWQVYRSDFSSPANDYLQLNTTIAKSTYGVGNGIWNGGATSSIFGVGPLSGVNGSGMTYVAYCFSEIAGYSKMGSYTGNGSADGTFVYCGFRPRYILQKASSTTSQWMIFDTSRNTYNVLTNAELLANSSAAEGTGAWGTEMDILSNGFKFRGFDNTNFNYTGVTYIYYAVAETPFKNALAR